MESIVYTFISSENDQWNDLDRQCFLSEITSKTKEFIKPDVNLIIYVSGGGLFLDSLCRAFKQTFLKNDNHCEIIRIISRTNNNLSERLGRNNYDRIIWTEDFLETFNLVLHSSNNLFFLGSNADVFSQLVFTEKQLKFFNEQKNVYIDTSLKAKIEIFDRSLASSFRPSETFKSYLYSLTYGLQKSDVEVFIKPLRNNAEEDKSSELSLEFLRDELNAKLGHKKNFPYSNIEGLDFAYTIVYNGEHEESKFSSVASKEYLIESEKYLQKNSILRKYIDSGDYTTHFYFKNYNSKDLTETFTTSVIYEQKIEENSFQNNSDFNHWISFLKEKNIGSSSIFLLEKFEESIDNIPRGYSMYFSIFLTLNIPIFKELALYIRRLFDSFLLRESNRKSIEIFERKQKKLKTTSLKSALASVMARNLSHNIGSHVLNKLSEPTTVTNFFQIPNSFFDIEKRATRGEVYSVSEYFTGEVNKEFTKDNLKLIHPYNLSRVFNDYLKKRMDFIADVTTSDSATLSIAKPLFKGVFRNFERNLLLLHHISGKGENYSYKFDFKLNGENAEDVDPIVSIPNDVLGEQAFFVILENIIRNNAKHAGAQKKVTFTIDVDTEGLADFYRITIYDDVVFPEGGYELKKLIFERNKSIADSVLDENNEIRKNGWGTLELKIAACYLSGLSTSQIDDEAYSPIGINKLLGLYTEGMSGDEYKKTVNKWTDYMRSDRDDKYKESPKSLLRMVHNKERYPILQAVDGLSSESTKGFGYTFVLKKPKEVLTVFSNAEDINSERKIVLNRLGITVYNSNEFQEVFSRNKDENLIETVFNHDILLSEVDIKAGSQLPQRHRKLNTKEATELRTILIEGDASAVGFLELVKYYFWKVYEEKINKPYYFNIDDLEEFAPDFKGGQGSKLIQFDHHGERFEKDNFYYEPYGSTSIIGNFFGSKFRLILDAFESNEDTLNLYFEEIRTNWAIPSVLNNADRIVFRTYSNIFCQIIEAVETKILVLDERIQAELNNSVYTVAGENETEQIKLAYSTLFDKLGIIVPKANRDLNSDLFFPDLNQSVIIGKTKGDEKWIKFKSYLEKASINMQYLVIHFGIIESFRNVTDKLHTSIQIKDEICDCINKDCKVILTSGRGMTKDVIELGLPFISYSAFSSYLIDPNNRSKIHLVNLLKSSRK